MTEPLTHIQSDTDFKAGTLLLIDKPKGITSFKVVKDIRYWIKKTFQIKEKLKVGHAGTLDPLASGLLIICTGRMTKSIESFQQGRKTYIGTFVFGATTPSFDMETEIDKTFPTTNVTQETLRKTFNSFTGEIKQTPPIYSAVKVKGRRAYDYARKDDEVKLKEKEVTIHDFKLISLEDNQAVFQIECSKGTYIRSLARDIGTCLNTGAYLGELRRTNIGEYNLQHAFSLEEIKKAIENIDS
ncbi:MAG: tRNA pseudouridine(55) synthase TruB [Bacteroidales bacterium]|nr:tRNA pseudouridine(55) synthase TruB [Bacteroidales bacterium]MCF8327195.1 tRNA pseudouridine(55) synthase TruB [Bacteroidales bacterium]